MAFNLPIGTTSVAKVGPTWIRPADWPVITDTDNEVQILFADTGQATIQLSTAFSATSLTIDWGDGTNDVITSPTANTTHTYVKGTGTPCSRGYTTFKIRLYMQSVGSAVLTSVRPQLPSTINNQSYSLGVLEMHYGNLTQPGGVSSFFSSTLSGGNSTLTFGFLEYVKLPATVGSTVSYNFAFSYCSNLRVVILPVSSPGTTTWNSTFVACANLQSITIPSDTNITTLASAFSGCFALKALTLPSNLDNLTTLNNAFTTCYNLTNIILPALPICTDYTAAFQNCTNLVSVTFLGLNTIGTAAVNFTNLFQNCYKLEMVNMPASVPVAATYNFSNVFNSCSSLRTFTLPAGFRATTFTNAFISCTNLLYVDIRGNGAMSTLAGFGNAFSGCYSLTEIVWPTSGQAGASTTANMISNCHALETLVIPNGLGPAFQNFNISQAYGLKTITLPATMNNMTSLVISQMYLLENLTLPTSASACTAFTISTNQRLQVITLPTLPTTLNTLALFNNPSLLAVNNMPTVTSINTFANIFNNCASLKSIVLPATVSTSVTSYGAAFGSCYALESITFPTTQNTATSFNLGSMFINCANLTTIVNFDKAQTTSNTPIVEAGGLTTNLLPGLTFSCKLARVQIQGNSFQSQRNRITSLRFLNTGTGQWTGSSPQINISETDIGYANLVTLFNDIAATGTYTGKTINITNCAGAASLTAADRLIITSKGWTITG